MINVAGLPAEVEDLGLALGLLAPSGGGVRLVEEFFADPWTRVGKLVASDVQRAALVRAIEGMLPAAQPRFPSRGAGQLGGPVRHVPLLEEGGKGQVYLVVERAGLAASAPLTLAIAAEAGPVAGGPAVTARVDLLVAASGTVTPVAASKNHPIRLRAQAPLGDSGASVEAAVLLVAPPDEAASRITVTVRGLPGTTEPLVLDPAAGSAQLALLVTALLRYVLAEVGDDVPAPVQLVAANLPGLLGLAPGLVPLPLGDLAADPAAFRSWLAALVAARAPDGAPGLVGWLDSVAGLLGADPSKRTDLPTDADPLLIPVVAGPPSVDLTVAVRSDPATGAPALVLGARVGYRGTGALDATVLGDAVLLVVPLAGTAPTTLFERLDVLVAAPAGAGRLYPAAGEPAGAVQVGGLRAGLRYRAATGSITPLLELRDVTVAIGDDPNHLDLVDLTDARSLTAAAQSLLEDAIEQGLGAAAGPVEALRRLLGLGTTPGIDLGLLTTAPTRALAAYYRRLRQESGGWSGVLEDVARLAGAAAPVATGAGSAADPWRVAVPAFAAMDGAPIALELILWDSGTAAAPVVELGLGLRGGGHLDPSLPWRVDVRAGLASIPLDGAAGPAWLSGVSATVAFDPPALATDAPVRVSTGGIRLDVGWSLGSAVTVSAAVDDFAVAVDGVAHVLGDLVLPPAGPIDPTAADLGLGIDPAALWGAARALLARVAESWAGPTARDLLAMVGIAGPATTGPFAGLPPLLPPDPADLSTLLADPAAAVRGWLADLARDEDARTDAGVPYLRALLQLLQAALTDRLPALPGQELPPIDLPVTGGGTPAVPWRVPMQRPGDDAVELLAWLEPQGPPAQWAVAPLIDRFGSDDPQEPAVDQLQITGTDVLETAEVAAAYLPEVADAIATVDAAHAAAALAALSGLLTEGDGLVPADAALPAEPGWRAGALVGATHDTLTSAPGAVTQLRDEITARTAAAGDDWAVLLLAPPLAGARPWDDLLADIPADQIATVDLRVPGTPPDLVDLATLPAARWYVVDLADDGTLPAATALAALRHVQDAVRAVRPGVRTVLVGHSYLGLVARQLAAAVPTQLLGLITIGTVFDGTLLPLDAPAVADGVRLASMLAPAGLPATPLLDAALGLQRRLLDGYATVEPGQQARPAPLPAAAFTRWPATPVNLQNVPALALFGSLGDVDGNGAAGELHEALVAALTSQTVAGAGPAELPTHAVAAVRLALDLGAPVAGDPDVDVDVRLGLGAVALHAGAAQVPSAQVRIQVARPDGWLLGGPGTGTPLAARVRALTVRATVRAGEPGPVTEVEVVLHDAALRGDASTAVDLLDPRAPELIDALLQELDRVAAPGGRLTRLLTELAALGVIHRAAPGRPAAVLADAITALRTDATAWLASRLPALVDRTAGLLGLVRDPNAAAGGGPWRRRVGGLPVELVLEAQPWRLTARTTGTGLRLGHGVTLTGSATVPLADPAPQVQAALAVGGVTLTRTDGTVSLAAPWLAEPVGLLPAAPDLPGRLAALVPRLLVNAALGVLLEQIAGGDVRVASLDGLLTDPAGWVQRTFAGTPGSPPQAAPLADLLRLAAAPLGLAADPAHALTLPGGISLDLLDVGPADAPALRLLLATDEPIELWDASGAPATLDLALHLDVDGARQVQPGGELTLHLPLPGDWGALDVRLGADVAGLSVAVTPAALGATLTLLPTVTGMDTLVQAAGSRLLPEVLDRLTEGIRARDPHPAVLDDVLDVAEAIGIYDPQAAPHGFAARAGALADLAEDLAAGGLAGVGPAAASAAVAVLRHVLGAAQVPDPAAPGEVVVRVGVLGGTVELRTDLAAPRPALGLAVRGVAAGALTADVVVGYTHPKVTAELTARAYVDTGLGVALRARLSARATPEGLAVRLGLLGTDDAGTGELSVQLAPVVQLPGPAELAQLAQRLVVPMAGTLALRAAEPWLRQPLWPGGRTAGQVLTDAGVAVDTPDGMRMAAALPTPIGLLRGALDAVTGVAVPVPGGLALSVVADGARYGIVLSGELTLPAGDTAVQLRFGLPGTLDVGWGPAGQGVGLLLLDLTNTAAPQLRPVLRLGGLGMRVAAAASGKALVETGGFRLGAASAHVRADLALTGSAALGRPTVVDGAVVIEGLGFPMAPGGGGSNPVAASLLQTGGGGDATPANPPIDVLVARGGGRWLVLFGGKAEARFEINRSYGPLHIAELALLYKAATTGPGKVGVAVDGGVAVAGLTLDVDDLSLLVPLRNPTDLRAWEVDLTGLSLSFTSPGVSIAGGLVKVTGANGVQYDGMLSVDLAGRGLTAVGSYARPRDDLGEFTSLFVFLSVGFPLGGPPYLYVLGLGGGAGYNRKLLVPRDPQGVTAFPLVKAIDDGGFEGAGGPMGALARMSRDIPPARGAFWLAAGVKFTTFQLLHTTALAYVSADRGLEVGLLGLMRMALPDSQAAVLNVELALAARYSTVDKVLSVRAALTRNSWLLSRDCQLVGGFAFMVWFDRPEVLLSIGGYHPRFRKPAHYPDVPRVGFHWSVGGGVVVKGDAYFTLTPSAVMLGGRLEASYDRSPVRIWFVAALDVIVRWDPLSYEADIAVSVGARFTIKVCFFACARINVSVSLGAWVHIEGPPLRGTVTVDLAIASVTVRFGKTQPQSFPDWSQFATKYLGGGDAAKPATAATVTAGNLPPAIGSRPDGTLERPWSVAPEFAVRVESLMPLAAWRLTDSGRSADPTGGRTVEVVPSGNKVGHVNATMIVTVEQHSGTTWTAVPAAQVQALRAATATTGFPAGLWDGNLAGDRNDGSLPTMVQALSSVNLAAPVTVSEATGALGDVALATMIEEEQQRHLPLSVAGAPAAAPSVLRRPVAVASRSRSGTTVTALRAAGPIGPRLRATVSADQRRGPVRPITAQARAAQATGDALPLGSTQIWDTSGAPALRLRLEEGATPLRLATFTSTGAPISDGPARPGVPVPAEAAHAVVTPAAGGTAGWTADTPLVPVTDGVLVAPGATILLPGPWRPPARYRRAGAHVPVPAALLAAAVDGLVTTLPATTRSVVVALEPAAADADLADVRVELEGVRVSSREDAAPDRILLTVDPEPGARTISVQVVAGDGWRVCGVIGSRDDVVDPYDPAARAELTRVAAPTAVRGGDSAAARPATRRAAVVEAGPAPAAPAPAAAWVAFDHDDTEA
ncbi:hypothetical protein GA0074695_4085 [Micromonospora viridifaciens]|uniref:DUF6603 domain-containing protein n=1 Tax=Micromonospora viridifaciens TaxID=1881 RepID=A0A1C4YC17_MICVI|nr:DUF6603 domain-containing protein [Micromonospora viridifaciens]SCF18220.1 hypothetical protein GA0074695_4085 [Micromonospora viridifaciens]